MSKQTIKLTLGIKSEEAPVFLEGEEPGVFVTREIELEKEKGGLSDAMFAKWVLDQEKEMIEDCVEFKAYELKDVNDEVVGQTEQEG